MLLLVFSLLLERYCFICTVTKTENFSYITILVVILLNCLINIALKYS
jgi:hypothetical protein